MNKLPYTDFLLPTRHLAEGYPDLHYVPVRTRDTDEAERRRALPSGTILLEGQARGARFASRVLELTQTPEGQAFAAGRIAASGLNTSWYALARGANVMNRRLKLPTTARLEDDWRTDTAGLMAEASAGLQHSVQLGEELVSNHIETRPNKKTTAAFSRTLGNACLELGCVSFGLQFEDLSAFDAQALARSAALEIVERVRVTQQGRATYPSLAQLTDPDSDVSVMWRRDAPDDAFDAWTQAYEEHAV